MLSEKNFFSDMADLPVILRTSESAKCFWSRIRDINDIDDNFKVNTPDKIIDRKLVNTSIGFGKQNPAFSIQNEEDISCSGKILEYGKMISLINKVEKNHKCQYNVDINILIKELQDVEKALKDAEERNKRLYKEKQMLQDKYDNLYRNVRSALD